MKIFTLLKASSFSLLIGIALLTFALSWPNLSTAHVETREQTITRIQERGGDRIRTRETIEERRAAHLCRVAASRPYLPTPPGCDDSAEPEPESPIVTFSANPVEIAAVGTSSLAWTSNHTTFCAASGGWQGVVPLSGGLEVSPGTTTEYILTCSGAGGTTSAAVTITVETDLEPEPSLGSLVISEVLYDLAQDGSQGSEAGGANEWVELYNASNTTIDLKDWQIGSGSSNDVLATDSLIVEPGTFVVVTNATSTADFWDFSGIEVIYLLSSISGGLSNGGDVVKLFDDTGAEIDAVSYGNNTDAFDPSVPGVSPGNSILRNPLATDTDSAADWVTNDAPSPGQ